MGRWTAYGALLARHRWDERRIARRLAATECDGRGRPVVFVHGYAARKSCWLPIMRAAQQAGHRHIRAAGYSVWTAGLDAAGHAVARKVVRTSQAHGGAPVAVVAHSMGGIATLWAATYHGVDEHLDQVVTLATPYGGSPLASIAPRWLPGGRTARQLEPGADTLVNLRTAATHLTVPWAVLYSSRDELVPVRSARALHGDNVTHRLVSDHGHVELLGEPDVAAQVVGLLGEPDVGG